VTDRVGQLTFEAADGRLDGQETAAEIVEDLLGPPHLVLDTVLGVEQFDESSSLGQLEIDQGAIEAGHATEGGQEGQRDRCVGLVGRDHQ